MPALAEMKRQGKPISALTAYDYATSRLVDEAGIDLVLVGDSLAMVVLGHDNTLAVTVDEMLHHTRAVRRAVRRALVVADMPFGSYHGSVSDGTKNAVRFVKEAGAEAVKIEGPRVELVRALTEAEIPVVGHLGLTPQSVHRMGGYRVQARSAETVLRLKQDAHALADAGAGLLVLEGIPREAAAAITAELAIPTIGIGAGPDCDGQILVFHDLLNLTFAAPAKFVRRYGDAAALIREAVEHYREDVERRTFPSDEESYHLPDCPARSAIECGSGNCCEAPDITQSLMQILRTVVELREWSRAIRCGSDLNARGRGIGLVPTMGALHAGHASLIRAAAASCSQVAVSIFVNPTQFGPNEDFARYPRSFDADCALAQAAGATVIFAPSVKEIYPYSAATYGEVAGLRERLDGKSRPGHFRGVATGVSKLLIAAEPDRAFFGQKDAAQECIGAAAHGGGFALCH